jgi:hypothetical protein
MPATSTPSETPALPSSARLGRLGGSNTTVACGSKSARSASALVTSSPWASGKQRGTSPCAAAGALTSSHTDEPTNATRKAFLAVAGATETALGSLRLLIRTGTIAAP